MKKILCLIVLLFSILFFAGCHQRYPDTSYEEHMQTVKNAFAEGTRFPQLIVGKIKIDPKEKMAYIQIVVPETTGGITDDSIRPLKTKMIKAVTEIYSPAWYEKEGVKYLNPDGASSPYRATFYYCEAQNTVRHVHLARMSLPGYGDNLFLIEALLRDENDIEYVWNK